MRFDIFQWYPGGYVIVSEDFHIPDVYNHPCGSPFISEYSAYEFIEDFILC